MPNQNPQSTSVRSRYLVLCITAMCVQALVGELSNAQSPSQAALADSANSMSGLEDITVTARREKETILDVPQSITGFSEKTLENMHIESFQDYATKVPNLSFSYGTGGLGFGESRTIAIRGISGAGTTGTYIDDTPVPESIDPRVVDIQRIEVLKGPQGTLYGEGSLGGNVKLITNQPSFDGNHYRVGSELGWTQGGGSPDYGASGMANLVLKDDLLALRLVAFENHDAGFTSRSFPDVNNPATLDTIGNQGAVQTYGGSIALLFKLSESFSATARILAQHGYDNGLPTGYAPFPAFEPSTYDSVREANVQEFVDDGWFLPSLTLEYKIPEIATFTSSTSLFRRREHEVEDSTEGTAYILGLYGVPPLQAPGGYPWGAYTNTNQFTQEVRAAFDGNKYVHGVLGGYLNRTWDIFAYPTFSLPGLTATGLWPNNVGWVSAYPAMRFDRSIFGEVYFNFANFELTLGLRKYWLYERNSSYADGFLDGGLAVSSDLVSGAQGTNPKAALSYKFDPDSLVYVSASKGFRAGYPNPALPSICDAGLAELDLSRGGLSQVNPDTVWNYEVGAKDRVGNVILTGALFQMNWNHIQQSVAIPICQITVGDNAGAARIRGAELEFTGNITRELDFRVGIGYEDPKIVEQGISGQPVGSRIFQIPAVTGVFAANYTQTLPSNFEGYAGVDYNHTGSVLSGTEQYNGQYPTRPSYNIVNGRLGLRRDRWDAGFYLKNIFDARPNLGDLSPLAYPRVLSNGDIDPRVALLQPRTIGVQMRVDF